MNGYAGARQGLFVLRSTYISRQRLSLPWLRERSTAKCTARTCSGPGLSRAAAAMGVTISSTRIAKVNRGIPDRAGWIGVGVDTLVARHGARRLAWLRSGHYRIHQKWPESHMARSKLSLVSAVCPEPVKPIFLCVMSTRCMPILSRVGQG